MYKISFTDEALRNLQRLENHIAKRITDKLDFYVSQDNVFKFAKPLHGVGEKRYRFRVGDYRIIFTIEPDGTVVLLIILAVAHRKDVYSE